MLNSVVSCFNLEISNHIKIKDESLYIYLDNDKISKLTIKK